MADLLRLWHTLRPLKARQITARIGARLRPLSPPAPGAADRRGAVAGWTPAIPGPAAFTPPDRFTFLAQDGQLTGPESWREGPQPRLWFYNLHYFDDLARADHAQMREAHAALIARWVADNPPLTGTGWEPYPISLRIVNWVRWALCGGTLPGGAAESLAQQLRVLAARPEYHLLGNHLLANAKALWFGGLFFAGPEAERWRAQGRRLLEAEMAEQVLADGGHFERSPMYHGVILADLLDVLNVSACYGVAPPEGLAEKARPMLDWLAAMSHPDGDIAYFNDAARGVAPGFAPLAAYARRLGITPPDFAAAPGLRDLAASGYFRLDCAGKEPDSAPWAVIFDAAPVGAPYLLGHGHADTLSFEFSPGACRLIVNSGVSTYAPGPQRAVERGTPAHSTITLDGGNSSDVWDAFRCGRAAQVSDRAGGQEGAMLWAEAAHDGYAPPAQGGARHHRRLTLAPGRLEIIDHLTPLARLKAPVPIEHRLILAPGTVLAQTADAAWLVTAPDGTALHFDGDPALRWQIARASYAPRFGERENVPVLSGAGLLDGAARFHCCICSI